MITDINLNEGAVLVFMDTCVSIIDERGGGGKMLPGFVALPEHVWEKRKRSTHLSVISNLRRDWLLHPIHYKRRGIDGQPLSFGTSIVS